MEADISTFIGRFHPLFVHLPIGIILATVALELVLKSKEKLINWLWFFSFASALFAIFTGFQLSQGSSYPANDLFWHKWLGISVTVISLVIWLSRKYSENSKSLFGNALKIALVVILSIGGHIGGELTHGDGYLVEAAPGFIKKMVGYKAEQKVDLSTIHADSIKSYEHLIYPLLDQKCVQCHTEKSASGNLVMTSQEEIMKGGDSGDAIVPGDASESEIFKRVTLSQSSVKFMPTKGVPMNYNEMLLLKWWLDGGADFEQKTGKAEMNSEVLAAILSMYNVDFTPRPWYEKEKGPEIDSTAVQTLKEKGFKVSRLSNSDNYVEVANPGSQVGALGLSKLKENIFILDLKNTELSSDAFAELSELKNVIRLQLQQSNATSGDIKRIEALPRLEAINLFGTAIDDEALNHLSSFPALKRIYTWQTNVTDEGIAQINELRPDIEVIQGM